MNNIRELRALMAQGPQRLSTPDSNNQTILHRLAVSHDLDLLFACVCIGVSQKIRDKSNKLFSDYLERWEYDYLKQRFEARRIGKLWINIYKSSFDAYTPHGYSLGGVPMFSLIWENDLGVDVLERILDAGVDLDHAQIRAAQPPAAYQEVLLRYGWVPTHATQAVDYNFYPPTQWTPAMCEVQFTVHPVETSPVGLVGKTLVCISDTHWEHRKLHVPGGEFLICSGDLCMPWHRDLTDFLVWMGSQTHPHKILVAGNHDKLLQNNKERYLAVCKQYGIVYLEDSGVELEGIKFWGSPWTPRRPRNKNNAFTLSRPELMSKWNMIPEDTKVLITHCPPYAIGDCNTDLYKSPPYQGGDYGLRKTINRLPQLKVHAFGHQHFGRGMYKGSNGVYFVNSAVAHDPTAFVFT